MLKLSLFCTASFIDILFSVFLLQNIKTISLSLWLSLFIPQVRTYPQKLGQQN